MHNPTRPVQKSRRQGPRQQRRAHFTIPSSQHIRLAACVVSLSLATCATLRVAADPPDTATTIERISRDEATAEFTLNAVPSPSRTDAANSARITIIAGRKDSNSGGVARLNDGRLPTEEDQPGDNFFFSAGSGGGRLLLDLGESRDIQQINTYSWHTGVRAPQVYTVYGDAADPAAVVPTRREDDPATSGWRLIAAIDTRSQDGPPGGQHAVSIAAIRGGAIGRHTRLLFDVARAADGDRFALTFFSEIDVVDGQEHPAPVSPAPTVLAIGDQYKITFDTSETPDLTAWVEEKLKPVCAEWYPKIVELLPSDGYTPPREFSITFHSDMDGVAHTAGTGVHCAQRWFARNLEGEALGAVVHELVHVVQQYRRTRRGNPNPGWLVEGVADYIRWFLYEPAELRPRPNPARAKYTDSYRTTAAFLAYLVDHHDEDLVTKFNTAMRAGEYSPALWERETGRTVDELWEKYIETLRKPEERG
jgi:hypothetical protein